MGATTMNERHWEKIDAIFHAALERPAEQRATFLKDACGGDAELLREFEQLLSQDAKETVAIDSTAVQRATFL